MELPQKPKYDDLRLRWHAGIQDRYVQPRAKKKSLVAFWLLSEESPTVKKGVAPDWD